jgi:hypothetical protein
MDHGVVVFELHEVARNVPMDPPAGRLISFAHNRFGAERWEQLRATVSQYSMVDGAQLFSQALLSRVQDGRIFANPFANLVTVCELQNGQPMAFLNSLDVDARFDSSSELFHRWADFLEPLSKGLAARGLGFLVVLVPYKLAVYAPLLRGCQFDVRARWQYFYGLEYELRRRKIRVINALPPLRSEAEALLGRGESVYWPDDTHWNDAGIAVTARLIADQLQP